MKKTETKWAVICHWDGKLCTVHNTSWQAKKFIFRMPKYARWDYMILKVRETVEIQDFGGIKGVVAGSRKYTHKNYVFLMDTDDIFHGIFALKRGEWRYNQLINSGYIIDENENELLAIYK